MELGKAIMYVKTTSVHADIQEDKQTYLMPVWLNREFVTDLQCKKAAQKVEAGTDKARVTQ